MSTHALREFLKSGERLISPQDRALRYSGRIDFKNPGAPVLIYPCSSIHFQLTGKVCKVLVYNNHSFWENYLGIAVGGKAHKILLPNDELALIDISPYLPDDVNDVVIYKRQDACHVLIFRGIILHADESITSPPSFPLRRMEVYGDSVSAGEVAEAEDYRGLQDPEHQGQWSDSYDSYAWMTARKLNAQIHNIAQGGIALLDGHGYFNAPNYIGMVNSFDKLNYNPALGEVTPWDFQKYRPQVVVVAIGQNDAHPQNTMALNYESDDAKAWRQAYKVFVLKLRGQYPNATVILTTTILNHHPAWDQAIDDVCKELRTTDQKIHHFLYTKNGIGTHGHIRTSEAEEMSDELSAFINALGEEIWQEEANEDSIS